MPNREEGSYCQTSISWGQLCRASRGPSRPTHGRAGRTHTVGKEDLNPYLMIIAPETTHHNMTAKVICSTAVTSPVPHIIYLIEFIISLSSIRLIASAPDF